MTLLGASLNDAAIWLVPVVVVVIVLVGVLVVTVVLVRLFRSIGLSLRELRELRQVLVGRSGQQNPAGGDDPSAASAAEGKRVVDGSEGLDNERGDTRET
jgi:hypothetical protein